MHDFDYIAPDKLPDALDLVSRYGASARALAGGTDLIGAMRSGKALPKLVIDVKKISELNALRISDEELTLGAAVSCRKIWSDKRVADFFPALLDSAKLIGGLTIQGRASLGGNLCNAAPSGDSIPTMIVLKAKATTLGPKGKREIEVEKFCIDPGKNILADDELLVNVRIPIAKKGHGAAFLRFTPRNEMDIAIVNAASSVVLSASGDKFLESRIAIGAVAPTPLFVPEAGDSLVGKKVCSRSIEEAAKIAADHAKPISDMRGTLVQRKHLTSVMVTRTLLKAIDRAGGQVD